jgi:hypothetical protein
VEPKAGFLPYIALIAAAVTVGLSAYLAE